MKHSIFALILTLSLALGYRAWSDDKHDHSKQEESGKDEHGHDHDESGGDEHNHEGAEGDSHDHGGEGDSHGHGHEEEGGSTVGPDKGITEKGPLGFKLSAEAVKTIQPEMMAWKGGAFTIPFAAMVRIKETKTVFRVRDGWYKRVPVKVASRADTLVTLNAEDLQAGDQIVISSAGFLRMAEVIAEEGAAHGHSH